MLKKMMIKEWRERSGVILFAMAALVLFALAFTVYSRDKYALDVLAGTLILIFLPVFSLLLGASGFSSEFRDGAWAYLFSRPAKKWRLGLAKYLSLLTMLLVVLFLFALLAKVHPALKPVPSAFNFPLLDGRMPFEVLALVFPLLLFTTAFSLSVLSEHPLIVAFLTLLVWTVLPITATLAGFRSSPILEWGMYSSTFWLMFPLVPLSLFLAFLVTLNRSDFSQPRRRAWTFTKTAAIFSLTSISLVALLALGTGAFHREPYIYGLEVRNNDFYFATDRGFFKYESAERKVERLARHPRMWMLSMGGGKVAFVSFQLWGKSSDAELRIMNSDGTEEWSLVGTGDEKSPLYGSFPYPVRVSPRGDRVAFIAREVPKATAEELWVIRSDGTGLKGYDLGKLKPEQYMIVGFGNSGRSLFVLQDTRGQERKRKPSDRDRGAGARLLRVNLESGLVEAVASEIHKPYAASMPQEGPASGPGLIAYIHDDETTDREVVSVLDTETLMKQTVKAEDSVTAFRWNESGDKLAFLTQTSKLGIYSVAEDWIVQMRELTGYDLRWPTQALKWTTDGRIVLRRLNGEVSSVCLLNPDLIEQKAIPFPFVSDSASPFWSAGSTVIVEDTERHHLWALNLTTDKWLRIY